MTNESLIWIPAARSLPPFEKIVAVRGRKTKYSKTADGIIEGEAFRSHNYRGEDYWQDSSDSQAYWDVVHWRHT